MCSTYEEATELTVNYEAALAELVSHNADVDEFLIEVGKKEYYTGQEVLDWLGY